MNYNQEAERRAADRREGKIARGWPLKVNDRREPDNEAENEARKAVAAQRA